MPEAILWSELCALESTLTHAHAARFIESHLERLVGRIAPAIAQQHLASVTEEYAVFRIHRIEDATGASLQPAVLSDDEIARLLLSERRTVTTGARAELLSPRFSYYEDDLTVLTWSAALVVEPVAEDTDVQYVLEFANAQLLELRYHDSFLDAELPRMYEEIGAARRAFHILGRRFSRLLGTLQARVADATEAVERVDNALKVTDDVFLARIYTAALDLFRGFVWRRGIDRKVAIVRDAYTMLNAESQARRTEVLELTIIFLIVLELLLAMVRR